MTKLDEVLKIGLVVERRARVVIDKFIYILGEKFNSEDMYETLSEVKYSPGGTYMNDERMVNVLKGIGVIKSTSSSWGTSYDDELLISFFLL